MAVSGVTGITENCTLELDFQPGHPTDCSERLLEKDCVLAVIIMLCHFGYTFTKKWSKINLCSFSVKSLIEKFEAPVYKQVTKPATVISLID